MIKSVTVKKRKMNRRQRISKIIQGLFILFIVAIVLVDPDDGPAFAVEVFAIVALVKGIQMLFYYFSMARHMVGGKITLYASIILTDFGLFAVLFADFPKAVVMLIFSGLILFDGVISVLRAFEQRKLNYAHWRAKMVMGISTIIFALSFLFMLNSGRMVTEMFEISLLSSAFERIFGAFRRTSVRVEKL